MHRGQQHRHTITLSARRMDEEGTSTPIALAVCRLCAAQPLDDLQGPAPLDRAERCEGCAAIMGGLLRQKILRDETDLVMQPRHYCAAQRPLIKSVAVIYSGSDGGTIAMRLPIGVFCCRSFVRGIEEVDAPPSLSSLCIIIAGPGPSSVVLRYQLRV